VGICSILAHMIKFDVRLNKDTIDKINKYAAEEKRTKCGMARKILEEYFERKEAHGRK
jgi:predicted transcriptional regulator